MMVAPVKLVSLLLAAIDRSIVPEIRASVARGSPFFGAAVLARSDLSVLTASGTQQRASPLLHAEVSCVQRFFMTDFPDATCRPDPRRDTVFLSTHEPCSLCLSSLAWAGFSDVYYLFTHQESRDLFGFGRDIDILQHVFSVGGNATTSHGDSSRPLYNRDNKYFRTMSIVGMAEAVKSEAERETLLGEVRRVKSLFPPLDATYDRVKKEQLQHDGRLVSWNGTVSCRHR